jgi:hypothetical protein
MLPADNPSNPSNPVDSATGSEESDYPDLDEQSTSPGSHPWSASEGTTIVDMNAIHTKPGTEPASSAGIQLVPDCLYVSLHSQMPQASLVLF